MTIGQHSVLVYHLLFENWPDGGLPDAQNRTALLNLAKHSAVLAGPAPRIIHDSGGIGRSGTFITLDFLLAMLDEGRIAHSNNSLVQSDADENLEDDLIWHTVNKLREQRMMMVQTAEQYGFIYEVLKDEFRRKYTLRIAAESAADAITKQDPSNLMPQDRALAGGQDQNIMEALAASMKATQKSTEAASGM